MEHLAKPRHGQVGKGRAQERNPGQQTTCQGRTFGPPVPPGQKNGTESGDKIEAENQGHPRGETAPSRARRRLRVPSGKQGDRSGAERRRRVQEHDGVGQPPEDFCAGLHSPLEVARQMREALLEQSGFLPGSNQVDFQGRNVQRRGGDGLADGFFGFQSIQNRSAKNPVAGGDACLRQDRFAGLVKTETGADKFFQFEIKSLFVLGGELHCGLATIYACPRRKCPAGFLRPLIAGCRTKMSRRGTFPTACHPKSALAKRRSLSVSPATCAIEYLTSAFSVACHGVSEFNPFPRVRGASWYGEIPRGLPRGAFNFLSCTSYRSLARETKMASA